MSVENKTTTKSIGMFKKITVQNYHFVFILESVRTEARYQIL